MQVTVDATNAHSIVAALARNATDRGFPALAESIVVALSQGRGRAVSDAVGAAVGAEADRNATQVCRGPQHPSTPRDGRSTEMSDDVVCMTRSFLEMFGP